MKTLQLLLAVIALLLTQPARSEITDQQAIDFVKSSWQLTDLTDSAISQTLNSSYSGIPYKSYVSYFLAAPEILQPLATGNFKTAGKKAADFAADQLIDSLLEQAGLDGVVGPAKLAAWPIEHELNAFYQAVAAASFKDQLDLYFAARQQNTYSAIVGLQPADLLDAEAVTGGLVTKNDQGWLLNQTSYTGGGSVPNYTPAQFFEYAETMWQADQARARYEDDQQTVRAAFRAAASPQKPVITQQPQDALVSSGQSASFTVVVSGTGPFTYVWRFNGGVIASATNAGYVSGAAGQYQVDVSNAAGVTSSRIATLTVNFGEPTAITAPTANAALSGSVTVRATANSATKIEFYLDGYRQYTDSSTPFAWTWDTTTSANGTHALTAKAYNGTTSLGASAVVAVTVNNSTSPPITAPSIASVLPSALTGLPLPQTQLLRIIGSGFTGSSTLLFNGSIASDPVRVHFISANEIDYDIRTDTNAANWTVKVINGAQQSNLGYFTVVAPTPNTGSLTINLSPAGAVSAGGQWRVDGGSYRNTGDTAIGLTPGTHTVSFKSVSGYTTPADKSVTITSAATTVNSGSYAAITPGSYTLTLNYAPAQGGASPSPLVPQTSSTYGSYSYGYTAGSTTLIQASASTGYHFTGWSGDASGTANPTTITMNGNKSVTANFASGDPNLGTMVLTILPPAAAAAGVTWGWNADDYRASGTSVTSFPATFIFTIHPVDGWLGPNQKVVTITAGQTTNVTVTFTQDPTPGLLTVTLSPPDAVNAGAHWRVNGGAAQGSGASLSLAPGTNYSLSFDNIAGWIAPTGRTVTIQRSQTTVVAGNYVPPAGQPIIAAVHPGFGSLAGGTALTIEGVNFSAPANVLLGGKVASNVSVLSPSQIVCFTPSNSVYGTVPVVVQTTGGIATNLNGFTYGTERGNGLELFTSIGGRGYALAIQGNYAYVGEGSALLVVNISNPATPSLVGRIAMPGKVMGIALFGQYAYVANGDAGLQVVDIGNPSAPSLRGFYPATGWANGIAILGGKAYLADGAGLEIFDLGIPIQPTFIASTNYNGGADNVVVKATPGGVFAYLSSADYISIIDVSQATTPVIRGHAQIGGSWSLSIATADSYVFAATAGDGLHVINVANPDAPQDLGHTGGANWPNAVAAANGYLYTANGYDPTGFYVYSYAGGLLSQVANLPNVTASGGGSMVVASSRVFIAGGTSGLEIVDVSTPSSPSKLSAFTDSGAYGDYNSATLAGNLLFTVGYGGFKIFDVSNPAQPSLTSQNSSVGDSSGQTVVKGGFAYVSSGGGGANRVQVLNINNPSAPSIVGGIPVTTIYPQRMVLSGNRLLIAGFGTSSLGRLAVVDVSTPSSPVTHGILDFANSYVCASVAAFGNKAVAVTRNDQGDGTLRILDISNIDNPVQQGVLTNLGGTVDVQLSADGHYAFVPDRNNSRLRVVDVSTPSSPIEVTNVAVPGAPWSATVQDNMLYVAATWPAAGVYGFDVSNPVIPSLTRNYPTPGQANGVTIASILGAQKDIMFVPNLDGGLAVLRIKDTQPPSIYITDPTFSPIYTNLTGTLNLGGGASDNQGVSRVTWSNDRGGGGDATGTESWFASGITLQPGTNLLSATAFDQAGNSTSDIITVVFLTAKQSQTIAFPALANKTFGDGPVALLAAASSGLPVSFNVISGSATVSNNVLALTGAGSVTVRATQLGDDNFNPATPTNQTFNVAKADQSITFAPLSDKLITDAPFTMNAAASSALPVTFSVVSGPATVTSNTVAITGAGAVFVRTSQSGNSNYNAAPDVDRSFVVAKLPQFITFNSLSRQLAGDAPFPLTASASSGLPVDFSVLNGPAIVSGNMLTMTGAGIVVLRASQSGDATNAPAPNVDHALLIAPGNNIITDFQRLVNGMFTFRYYGEPGTNYVVQGSTNLVNWSALATNQVSGLGYLEFTDASATNYSKRFYRIAPLSALVPNGPVLSLTLVGNAVVVSWDTNDSGFTLESANNLPPTTWLSNAIAPVIINGRFSATNPISSGSGFYRLKK